MLQAGCSVSAKVLYTVIKVNQYVSYAVSEAVQLLVISAAAVMYDSVLVVVSKSCSELYRGLKRSWLNASKGA